MRIHVIGIVHRKFSLSEGLDLLHKIMFEYKAYKDMSFILHVTGKGCVWLKKCKTKHRRR